MTLQTGLKLTGHTQRQCYMCSTFISGDKFRKFSTAVNFRAKAFPV